MATGLGKSVVLADVIKHTPGRTLVLAHREELIRQNAATIAKWAGCSVEIEMAGDRADLHMFHRAKAVVASKDSLHSDRLSKWKASEFDLVITDESHHAVSPSYRRIYSHFHSARHLGVTATPDRLDRRALGQVYESVAYSYDLEQAIAYGWLVRPVQRAIHIEHLDLSGVRSTAGDLNQKQLAEQMESNATLLEVTGAVMRLAKWKKTLMFTASVRHAEMGCAIFNAHRAGSARWVCGETDKAERRQINKDFADGKFQYLLNVGTHTEGYDEPTIEMVVVARPTESRSLYAQMVGRGTRSLPGIVDSCADSAGRLHAIATSAKPALEVIDFEGNAGKHKLVSLVDILGGRYDDEVKQRVKQQTSKLSSTMAVDTTAALVEASLKMAEEKRIEALHGQKVEFTVDEIDPFDIFDLRPPTQRERERGEPCSAAQANQLKKFGIDSAKLTKKMASRLIGECFARRSDGKCTWKQALTLKKHGLPVDVSMAVAQKQIEELFKQSFNKGAA